MMRLWNYIKEQNMDKKKKGYLFVLANTILWVVAAGLIAFVTGGLVGFDARWLEWSVLLIGYAGVGMGFFYGIIYYMRHA